MMHEDCGMTQNYVAEDVGEAVDFCQLLPNRWAGAVESSGQG
jgi:hypothetical protein